MTIRTFCVAWIYLKKIAHFYAIMKNNATFVLFYSREMKLYMTNKFWWRRL